MKTLNVLIVDDNATVANMVEARIITANDGNRPYTIWHIKPHCCNPVFRDGIAKIAEEIANKIRQNSIEVLLLDRQIFTIIDPEKLVNGETYYDYGLKADQIYGLTAEKKGLHIEEVLAQVGDALTNIKGVIIYSYDDPKTTVAQIKSKMEEVFSKILKPDQIDVILTNSEIYDKADLKLWESKVVPAHTDVESIGYKRNFRVYGMFVGEILYHRALGLTKRRYREQIRERKSRATIRIFFLFAIFTGINVGASALYASLESLKKAQELWPHFVLAVIFGLVLPLIILAIKPEWILDPE